MSERIRLSKQERKNQICDVARKLFIEKGFENTTMKDIQKKSGISIGGLYYHYDNIYDILKDLIMSSENKKNIILSEIKTLNPNMAIEDILIQASLSIIFDKSENSILYVHLLILMKENDGLKHLYELRKKKAKEEFLAMLKSHNALNYKFLANDDFIDFFNAAKLGNYYFSDGDREKQNKKMYADFIKTYIRGHLPCNEK